MSLLEELNNRGNGALPGPIAIEILGVTKGRIYSRLHLRNELLAPNGYLHAATACGYGCLTNLPNGAEGCTTAELKSNFLGTKRAGVIECEAKRAHGGCATQIWGATVANTGKTIALFRCVHMILYPR